MINKAKKITTAKVVPPVKTSMDKLRVTQEQHDALMQAAHDRNITFSVYARKMLLKGIDI
jgi:hypothetical protein